ncbi:TPA: helix-turn-helix transcriptional regulator [Vibrio harveyi]
MNQSFNSRLRKLKEANGYSPKFIATKLNVTHRTVNSWLSGDSQPKADQVQRLAELFDVTPNDLYYDNVEDDLLSKMCNLIRQVPPDKQPEIVDLVSDMFKVAIPHIA